MKTIDFQIGQYGCFGGKTSFCQLTKTEDGYILLSKKTKKSTKVGLKAMDSLKNFFVSRFDLKKMVFAQECYMLRLATGLIQ